MNLMSTPRKTEISLIRVFSVHPADNHWSKTSTAGTLVRLLGVFASNACHRTYYLALWATLAYVVVYIISICGVHYLTLWGTYHIIGTLSHIVGYIVSHCGIHYQSFWGKFVSHWVNCVIVGYSISHFWVYLYYIIGTLSHIVGYISHIVGYIHITLLGTLSHIVGYIISHCGVHCLTL